MVAACRIAVAIACLFLVNRACGHEGPEHVIDDLTAQMARSGPMAELLYRRASEYRVLRKYAEAEADLLAALKLDDGFVPARLELSRVWIAARRWPEAAEYVDRLVAEARDDSLQSECLALRAELKAAQARREEAVADYTAAIAIRPDSAWFVERARLQCDRCDPATQLAGLREGYAATQHPILLRALCDALIDRGGEHLAEAEQIVEREIAANRFRAAWLRRRATIRERQGKTAAATDDLTAALAELDGRLTTVRPDPMLLAERSVVLQELGQTAAADESLRRAMTAGYRPEASLELFPPTTGDAQRKPTVISPDD